MSNINERNASITPTDIPKVPLLWLDEIIIMNEIANPIIGAATNN